MFPPYQSAVNSHGALCDGSGAHCFFQAVQNATLTSGCECPPDCDQIEFTAVKDTFVLDYEVNNSTKFLTA